MGTAIGIGVSPSLTSMLGAGSDPILPSGLWLDPDTWTRTGGRFSIGPDLSLDANEGDVFCMDGRDVNGIVDAATNLITTVATDWTNILTTTQDLSGSYGLSEDNTSGLHYWQPGTIGSVGITTFVIEIKKTGARDWILINNSGNSSTFAYFNVSNGSFGTVQGNVIANGATLLSDGFWRVYVTSNSNSASSRPELLGSDANDSFSYTGNGLQNYELRNALTTVGSNVDAAFPAGSGVSESYGADLATATAPAWPATGRTLTVSRRNYATGVISSVSTTPAPTAGNYVLDGSTDGNYTYLSRVSNNILTAGQIVDQEAFMEAILAATPEFCPNWDLVGGLPVYVNGVPIDE